LISVAVLLSAACVDDAAHLEGGDLPPLDDGSVRVNIQIEPASADTVVIRLRLDAQALAVGAYQGRFTFDPQQLALYEATVPDDDLRVVNPNDAASGVIRFGGITATGFEHPLVLTLRMRAGPAFDPSQLHADLEVVGDVLGAAVARSAIAPPTLQIAR
jgi:hypothetical protein